ncbi:MAG: alpha-L-glutamate ligase [Pseudanabaena sp. M090S1SP1A06QC]|nr:alpha-L-glutamate ligase [Pseudanabaena sp. M109S1SP1A06QC]MCA6603038.1 alpha-L-glutamate ligase [Pseudanabaena sp. M007S1SP1A06QC]MCA6613432.1 alpha-L-glutamate ligase [Pseudanabaena sp. M090S1SP1A06QC]MCA6624708.1 alpha-L-glutamate ligase [Pseudanabaena sp. M165S2SP1A06QC]
MLTNIRMLMQACKNSSIAYEILHPNQNVVKVKFGDREYYFTNYSTPLTSQSVAEIFKDKQYFYQIFQGVVRMPRTLSFISPYCDEKYLEYLEFSSIDKIITEIKKNFALPVILKRNRGSGGNNVFKCTDLLEVRNALDHIFNINSKNYDYVALVQEPIHIVKEYRSVCLNHEQIVLYEKDISQAKFTGNLSPLHWEGAIAKQIDDVHVMQAINQLIKPIFQKMAIAYVGLDIAFDNQGNYWLIEANSHPNFDIFIRDNGEEAIVQLFQKILEYLKT